jgi:CelD/BcsL family acetyltransferase involved in cellulose biosynthesis
MKPALDIAVSGVADYAALEAKWRDLESRADPSFFQSWTWTGCMAEERFRDPVLVEARESGRTVALALFNRRRGALYLGESGDPALDSVYIEFNGVLAVSGREAELTAICLDAARTGGRRQRLIADVRKRRLILSGVSAATAAAAGHIRFNRSLAAPLVDLSIGGDCFLERRSANTRHQVRRSNRSYAATNEIAIERAATLPRALEFLEGLAALHQATWVARGKPGAFANPFFGRFHHALIERGLPRGEIDLLRITAERRVIGFLYNFRYRDRVSAYQSGFDYLNAGRHEKPGLTCHYQAIRFAAQRGAGRYDFLAGDDRYKRSLSDRAETLHWIEVAGRYSARFLVRDAWRYLTAQSRRGKSRRAAADPAECL